MPLQDADVILLDRFFDYFSGTFGIIAMLELPIVAELELLSRFLPVSAKIWMQFSFLMIFGILTGFPRALVREASP